MDDDDPLRFRPIWFLDKPVHVIQVAGEQNNGAFQPQRRGGYNGVDGAPVTRKPGCTQQFPLQTPETRLSR